MAYIENQENDDQEQGMNVLGDQEGQQDPGQGEIPLVTGDGGSSAPTDQPQQPQTSRTRKQTGSGMFTNVRKYIEANKPQAKKIAQTAAGQIEKEAGQIGQQVQKQKQSFLDKIGENRARFQQAQQFTEKAVEQAGSGALTADDFKKYQDIAGGKSTYGEQDIQAPQIFAPKAAAARLEETARTAPRAEGRADLLRRTFGADRQYTRGQRSIDALLLAGSPEASKELAQKSLDATKGLTSDITSARRSAIEDIAGLRGDVGGFLGPEGQAMQQITGEEGALTGLQSELDVKRQAETERLTQARAGLMDRLNKGEQLTAGDIELMGLSETQQSDLGNIQKYGLRDLGRFVGDLDPEAVSRGYVSSPEELARYNALTQLVGQEGLTAGGAPLGVDKEGFLSAINEQARKERIQKLFKSAYLKGGFNKAGKEVDELRQLGVPTHEFARKDASGRVSDSGSYNDPLALSNKYTGGYWTKDETVY